MASSCQDTSIWSKSRLGSLPEPSAASLLWLLSSLSSGSEALITNISVIQTWRWFFALTPFEAVFLGMIMMQICTLQLLGILPINVNQLVNGASSGRKKRNTVLCNKNGVRGQGQELTGQILNVIHRSDKYGCLLRTLCELQKQANLGGVKIPDSILLTLAALSKSSSCQQPSSAAANDTNMDLTQKFLPLYAEAVEVGHEASNFRNSTECELRYNDCPLGTEEILSYIHQMRLDEIF